jgi:TolR protein
MLKTRRYRQVAEINVVPYIDVMLVLLVIFMVTAPMLFQGIDVDLPEAKTEQLNLKNQEPIVLSIDGNGDYYLNINTNPGQKIMPKPLLTLVTKELAAPNSQSNKNETKTARPVLIKGDKKINYGVIVQAMSLLQEAGAKNIGLVIQEERSTEKIAQTKATVQKNI